MLTPAQLEARLSGVGGTDAGVILGLSKWKSPYTLWREKRRLVALSSEETDAMEWGNILEPEIAKHYSKRTGRKVRRTKARTHRDYPWMRCNTDRIILGDARGPGILEIKTVNAFAAREWTSGGVPDVYYAQLQHNIAVHGYRWGAFAILIGGQQPVYFDVPRDENFIIELIKKEAGFWAMVQSGEEPPLDGSEATKKAIGAEYPKDNGVSIFVDDALPTVEALVKAKAVEKLAGEEVTRLENELKARLGEATTGVVTGWGQVVWKKNKDSEKEVADLERLRIDQPAIYAEYVKKETKPGARVLRLVPEKAMKPIKVELVSELASLSEFREALLDSSNSRMINFDL